MFTRYDTPPGLDAMLPPFVWEPTNDLQRHINDEHVLILVINLLYAAGLLPRSTTPGQAFNAAKFMIEDGLAWVILHYDKRDIEVLALAPQKRKG